MENVITRIMEIEKQAALDIEQAKAEYRNKIDAQRRTLEQDKEREHALINDKENARLTGAVRELNKQTEEASQAEMRDYENIFRDRAKIDAIKEKIAEIILTG